jgi:hypothetical protein
VKSHVADQALDSIFEPTAGLLQRYSRFADKDELDVVQAQVDKLQQALCLARSQSDIYEAYRTRQALRKLNQELQENIRTYRHQKSF